MAIKHEIPVLGEMMIRALKEENESLNQAIPFYENETDHIVNRINANNIMIRDISLFASAR